MIIREIKSTDLEQLSELFDGYRIFYRKDSDIDSARELIGNWKERSLINNTSEAEAAKQTKRDQALKAGKGVSRTSSESTAGKKIYRRADLIRLRTNDPSRYEDLQGEILQAYADGRVK